MEKIKNTGNDEFFADVERIVGEGGSVRMRLKGNSMRPFLRDGIDEVELAPVDRVALRKGMVVLFRYQGRHVLHRVRRIDSDRLVIKGDGNYRIEETVTRGDVVCNVSRIYRNGREIVYGSPRWRILTARSLTVKTLRNIYHSLFRKR